MRSLQMLIATASMTARLLVGQTVCDAQLIPLKPTALLSCQTAKAICVTDPNGFRGRWVWMCVTGSGNNGGIDPSIPLRGTPAPPATAPADPLNTVLELERLRQLRLQNQQIEQQLNEVAHPTADPPPVRPVPSLLPRPTMRTTTFGSVNGIAWIILDENGKKLYLAGVQNALTHETKRQTWIKYVPNGDSDQVLSALDMFYTNLLNLAIPIVDALRITIMMLNSEAIQDIEDEITLQRDISNRDPELKKP
jgi:hypothetical protein